MARSLASKTNVIAPGGSYPYGRLKNNSGANDGTPVDEALVDDMSQFFEKLLADAGIAANGQPENSSSGFQYNLALAALLNVFKDSLIPFSDTGFSYAAGSNGTGGGAGSSNFGFKLTARGTVKFTGTLHTTAIPGGVTFMGTLPVGYRPAQRRYKVVTTGFEYNLALAAVQVRPDGTMYMTALTAAYNLDDVQCDFEIDL